MAETVRERDATAQGRTEVETAITSSVDESFHIALAALGTIASLV